MEHLVQCITASLLHHHIVVLAEDYLQATIKEMGLVGHLSLELTLVNIVKSQQEKGMVIVIAQSSLMTCLVFVVQSFTVVGGYIVATLEFTIADDTFVDFR